MIEDKKFVIPAPERGVVLPIKMERDRWMSIALNNNMTRVIAGRRAWFDHELDHLYETLHP